jgi:hypothetical protein
MFSLTLALFFPRVRFFSSDPIEQLGSWGISFFFAPTAHIMNPLKW